MHENEPASSLYNQKIDNVLTDTYFLVERSRFVIVIMIIWPLSFYDFLEEIAGADIGLFSSGKTSLVTFQKERSRYDDVRSLFSHMDSDF